MNPLNTDPGGHQRSNKIEIGLIQDLLNLYSLALSDSYGSLVKDTKRFYFRSLALLIKAKRAGRDRAISEELFTQPVHQLLD